jgi:hypothetical protein
MKLPNVKRQYRWAVRRRLRIVVYVEAHILLGASQHFGLDRKTLARRQLHVSSVLPQEGMLPRYAASPGTILSSEALSTCVK